MKIFLSIRRSLALAAALTAPMAQAEITACTPITTAPVTISTPGIYCFTADINTNLASGNAITIASNNVTIDMNGHKFGNLAAGVGTAAYGFYASQQKNITIRNGTIRGFYAGVFLDDVAPYTGSSGNVIEDLRADGNTVFGLQVEGSGNIVRHNQVVNTGGSTVYSTVVGISSWGPDAQILDNIVNGTVSKSSGVAYGIYLQAANGSMPVRNHVTNVSGGTLGNYGIYVYSGTDVIVADNRLAIMPYGVYYNTGSTGKYYGNVTQGVTTPYTGGSAAGATNY